MPWPGMYAEAERPTHPYVQAMRACQIYDQGFDDPAKVRKAIAAYFGLVSFVDHNVGRLVKALEQNDLSGDTRVIYTSDHGDNLGTRGLWGKSNMYEESAGGADDHGRAGGAAGRRLPRAGLAGRLLPDHRRLRRACAQSRRSRPAGRAADRHRCAARRRSARC